MIQNIIIQQGLGANLHIRSSLVNSFRAAGYNVYFWDDSGKSPFDLFREFSQVNLFIGSTWQITRALVKCLAARPDVHVILYGDIWGDIQDNLDLIKYPVGIATEEQKTFTKQIREACPNFNHIISNHSAKAVETTHNQWKQLGLQVHSLPVSADTTVFHPRDIDPSYKVNLAYAGGYWPYKSINIDKYLLPLLYPNTDWNIRLFGSGWNVMQSVGNASDEEIARHYTNAMIIPHLVEPHCSDVYADWPLRYFQVAACGGFGISCPCVGIRDAFAKDELVVSEGPEDFFQKVVYYLNNPETTLSYRLLSMKRVLREHTGFHRCLQTMQMLNQPYSNLQEKIDELHTQQGISQVSSD